MVRPTPEPPSDDRQVRSSKATPKMMLLKTVFLRSRAMRWHRHIASCALLWLCVYSPAADTSLITVRFEASDIDYLAQLMPCGDHPISDSIRIGDRIIPATVDPNGVLHLTLPSGRRSLSSTSTFMIDTGAGSGSARTLRIRVQPGPGKSWSWRNQTVARLRIGSDDITVVDVNGNNQWNDTGIDGVAWSGQRYVFPLPAGHEEWCTLTRHVHSWRWSEGSTSCHIVHSSLSTGHADTLTLLRHLNLERVPLGLTPRPSDPRLDREIQLHCDWMVANNTAGHEERPGTPGYTLEGDAAGRRSLVSFGSHAHEIAQRFVRTLYHRRDIIRPDTMRYGVGFKGYKAGIDAVSRLSSTAPAQYPILCPAPFQIQVPPSFSGPEHPDPIGGDQSAGYPITAYFDNTHIHLLHHELISIDSRGRPTSGPIECLVFDHDQGPHRELNRWQGYAAIIPKDPLRPLTAYRVSLSARHGPKQDLWSRTWSFTTSDGREGASTVPPSRRR